MSRKQAGQPALEFPSAAIPDEANGSRVLPPGERTLEETLDLLRSMSHSEVEKGRAFELLVRAALLADPVQQQRFTGILRWKKWAHKIGVDGRDVGIDLVGVLADGGYSAIQCKFFDPQKTPRVSKGDIDSFLTTSAREFRDQQGRPITFTERLIVTSLPDWGIHAEAAIAGVRPRVQRLDLNDMKDFKVSWGKLVKAQRPRADKPLRDYQKEAIRKVRKAFGNGADRGKLIMACGTGKTLVSLRLTERQVPAGGRVLHLTPSLSLLSQTLNEWAHDSKRDLRMCAVCSDRQVHRQDEEDILSVDMPIPPTTDAKELARVLASEQAAHTTVVFATYQSLKVVCEAQRLLRRQGAVCEFDLVVADEAHRTAGTDKLVMDNGEGGVGRKVESLFTLVHSAERLRAHKRLYMTATPKVYGINVKKKAKERELAVYSMSDEKVFGKELYRYNFSKAVDEGYLSDYKVIVLYAYNEHVEDSLPPGYLDSEAKLPLLSDAAKMLGCWKAMRQPRTTISDAEATTAGKPSTGAGKKNGKANGNAEETVRPLRRVLAFTNTIKGSRSLTDNYPALLRAAQAGAESGLGLAVRHVDGAMNAPRRNEMLNWLRGEKTAIPDGECRMISNVRCLGEGVDVPALDGVAFFSPRKSQVDVVQAVGRVMRRARGKKLGYIILPVAIPKEEEQTNVLGKSKEYKHVWQVLAALRSHDERFEAQINKIEFERKLPPSIELIGLGDGPGGTDDGEPGEDDQPRNFYQVSLLTALKDTLCVQLLKNCGSRTYWANWAEDVGRIAKQVIGEIKAKAVQSDSFAKKLERFCKSLRDVINPDIQREQALEMLAQHWISKKVFDALFHDKSFSSRNSVSKNIGQVFKAMENNGVGRHLEELDRFYADVAKRAEGISSLDGQQNFLKELFQGFFQLGFKKDAEKLGIVYTPTEVVDFLLHSADHLVEKHFGKKLTHTGVDILDPFSGTGRFMARLLNNRKLIKARNLKRKYTQELHMNEIMLLPYYIGNVSMEQVYRHRMTQLEGTQDESTTFTGSVLTDSFQLYEGEQQEFFDNILPHNCERARRQKRKKIWVIVGNPPYSGGQKSANDANQNTVYPKLRESIAKKYAVLSEGKGKALYDSYVLAIRWATDRLKVPAGGDADGVVAFITNGGFIDGKVASGLRKRLPQEFSEVYVLNLRGDAHTGGGKWLKEGGKIFGQSSRVSTALLLLVKKKNSTGLGKIYYHDIGENLSREKKLDILRKAVSMDGEGIEWKELHPNKHGDWLDPRKEKFGEYLLLGSDQAKRAALKAGTPGHGLLKREQLVAGDAQSLFSVYTQGMVTSRDPWAWNHSRKELTGNMKRTICFYNQQLQSLNDSGSKPSLASVKKLVDKDPRKISWSRGLQQSLFRGHKAEFKEESIRLGMYRPFGKQYLYYEPLFNEVRYRTQSCWPTPETRNPAIGILGNGALLDFCVWATALVPEFSLNPGGQWFPMYWWDSKGNKHDNITPESLACFRERLGAARLSAEDLFHYAYGLLHHPIYRKRYSSNLKREMARLPCVEDWQQFVRAGRELIRLHIHYETVKPYALKRQGNPPAEAGGPMSIKFAGPQQRAKRDTSTVVVNGWLTLSGIPPGSLLHKVGGKSLPEWVINRYKLRTDKDSGIQNDPSKVSDDPMFLPDLFAKAVRVGVDTQRIVSSLPDFKLIITKEDKQ